MAHTFRWKPYIGVGLLFVPIALLLALMQRAIARPEVLDLYMQVTGEEIFGPRLLPRMFIQAMHEISLGRVSYKYGNYLLQLVSVWGALSFLFLFAKLYLRPLASLAATLLAALFLLCGFLGLGAQFAYPYDFPIFLLSTAGLWAIVTNRYRLLLLILVLGTLTKETMIWIVPAFFFFRLLAPDANESKRSTIVATCVLGFLYVAAYVAARALIREPGDEILRITASASGHEELRFSHNVRELLFLHGRGGVQSVHLAFALYVAPLLMFRALPNRLRPLFWAIPFFVVPHLFFANINELRLFNELIPLGAVGTIFVIERSWP